MSSFIIFFIGIAEDDLDYARGSQAEPRLRAKSREAASPNSRDYVGYQGSCKGGFDPTPTKYIR